MSELLTVNETAELLRRHPSTIYRRLEAGEWPFAWKDGNDWRIEKDALLTHLRSRPIHTRAAAPDPMHRPHPAARARFRELIDKEGRRA